MKIKLKNNMTITERDIFNLIGVILTIITVLLIGGSIISHENYFIYAFIAFIFSRTFYYFSERKK